MQAFLAARGQPVDFHRWRRAYNQALADAEVNAQQAAALAGHADLGAHTRYLANTSKMRSIPAAALPSIVVSSEARTKLESDGSESVSDSSVIAEDFRRAVRDSNA